MSAINTKDAAALLDLPRRTFDTHRAQGRFDRCLHRFPIGQRIWDSEALQRLKDGEPVTRFVHRRTA